MDVDEIAKNLRFYSLRRINMNMHLVSCDEHALEGISANLIRTMNRQEIAHFRVFYIQATIIINIKYLTIENCYIFRI